MSERILGRGAELLEIGALLADQSLMACALVLVGAAGVGKTTIWEEGVRLASERGLRVLAARAAEAEAALPFAALGDLLGPVADAVELPRPQRAALDRALQRGDADEPADRLPAGELGVQASRRFTLRR
jgi:AAA ATPase domain